MYAIKGYQLKIQNIFHLSQEQREYLRAKMAIFAIATKRSFDDPMRIEADCMTAYYKREECARETLKHAQHYLQHIQAMDKVTVTLVDTQLSLHWDEISPAGE